MGTTAASDHARTMFAGDRPTHVLRVGGEGEPVVVVDAASGVRDALVEAAARSPFEPAAGAGSGYPGLLGPAPTAYVRAMVDYALPLIQRHFGTGAVAPVRARGNFSLVATPPDRLLPEQRAPHADAADHMQFAVVHYLSPNNRDGTGFFRHEATGFETVGPDRLAAYNAARAREGVPPPAAGPGYPTDAGGAFREIGRVDAAPDRLVLYRAALLHSGLVSAVPTRAHDPRRGRLTGNLFLQCRTRP